jgi:hypothetical protein
MSWKFVAATALLCLATLLTPETARADCGGDGERACCNGCGEVSNVGTACNSGAFIFGTDTERSCGSPCASFIKTKDVCHTPRACGGAGQRACCVLEGGRTQSCDAGLVEGPGCSVGDPNCLCSSGAFALGVCTVPLCGAPGQRGCCIGERAPLGLNGPCGFGSLEIGDCSAQLGSGSCRCLQPSGSNSSGVCTDTACGGNGERACCVGPERTVNGLTDGCEMELVEFGSCTGSDCACKSPAGFFSSGRCVRPTACGGEGQRACCIGEREGAACDAGLVETGTELANLLGFSNASCTDQLGGVGCVCSSGAVSAGVCRRVQCGNDGERGCCVGNERQARGITGPCPPGFIEDTTAGCTGDCACTGLGATGSSLGMCRAVTAVRPVVTWRGALSGTYNQPATLMANLAFPPGSALSGTPIPGATLTMAVGGQSCTGITQQGSGEASCTLTLNQPSASYAALATFAGDINFLPAAATGSFAVALAPTTSLYTGATAGEYLEARTLSALVTETSSGLPAAQGAVVHFSLGQPELQGCSGIVDTTGNAACDLAIEQPAGSYPVIASALGNSYYAASSASATFELSPDTTLLRYTGPTLIANGQPLAVSASFADTSSNGPIAGQVIVFTLGAQVCSDTTDIDGNASCTISTVAQPLGPASIATSFAGNGYYLAAAVSNSALVFEYAAGGGSFVIAQSAASEGATVTFWGAQWAARNLASAPASFKGFAKQPAQPACGMAFSTLPGSSSNPPGTVPAYMAVIASTSITQSDAGISGDSPRIVIVKTAPGYAPNPGRPGTGRVVAVLCGALP